MKHHYQKIKETLAQFEISSDGAYFVSDNRQFKKMPLHSFRMDFYLIGFCEKGVIDVDVNNEHYKINANNYFVAAPSTILHFHFFSPDVKYQLLFFDKQFLLKNITDPFILEKNNLFDTTSFYYGYIDDQEKYRINEHFTHLKYKIKEKSVFRDEFARLTIFTLLLEFSEIISKNNSLKIVNENKGTDIYYQFSALVKKNILRHKDVEYYAKSLFVSNKYLINVVKSLTGKTPHYIINETLLKEACLNLHNKGLSISEVANILQFNSNSSFSRFFKSMTNTTPKEFRKKYGLCVNVAA